MPIFVFALCLTAVQSRAGQSITPPPMPQPQVSSADEAWRRDVADLNVRAAQGDADAQFQLARVYDGGLGPDGRRNFEAALKWYHKAAAQGHIEAQTALGVMYSFGKGIAVDDTLAVQWYREAAEHGDANAQNNLGALYEKGSGVALDYDEAFRWYQQAAAQGYMRALANLGRAYDKGRGVPQDGAEAAKWYRRAADLGDENGQFAVAYMYHTGNTLGGLPAGVPNQAEALKWCRKAAEQGHPSAALSLGISYAEGDGVQPDRVEGLMWMIIAVRQASDVNERGGYSDNDRSKYAAAKAAVARTLTASQAAEAEKRAEEWLRRFNAERDF